MTLHSKGGKYMKDLYNSSRYDKYLCGLMSDTGRVKDPLDRPIIPRESASTCEYDWDEQRPCGNSLGIGLSGMAKYNRDFKEMPKGF